jgi:coenzyme PQQ precursor peptide PqqA
MPRVPRQSSPSPPPDRSSLGVDARGSHIHQIMCPRAGREPEEMIMKVWNTPQVREQEVGLEVTSYLPAEIDII